MPRRDTRRNRDIRAWFGAVPWRMGRPALRHGLSMPHIGKRGTTKITKDTKEFLHHRNQERITVSMLTFALFAFFVVMTMDVCVMHRRQGTVENAARPTLDEACHGAEAGGTIKILGGIQEP